MPLAAPPIPNVPLVFTQAAEQFAEAVASSPSPQSSRTTVIFFRVPAALKVHTLVDPRRVKFLREASVFLDETIRSQEEVPFLKCLAYQVSVIFPFETPLDVTSCFRLIGVRYHQHICTLRNG